MLSKLAVRNVKRNFKSYGIYFVTLVMGVCIFYMFNSIYAQREVMVITEITNEAMKLIQEVLSYISVFVSIVMAFLIVYANNFFIRRRKKEIGIYLTLGMSRIKIASIVVIETFIIGMMAMIFGVLLGVFASQFTSVFTAKIFEADMSEYVFVFSKEAMFKSILYFSIIFVFVMLINVFTINKSKLIDFMQGNKKNDELILKNRLANRIIFFISLIMIGSAYVMIIKRGILTIDLLFMVNILLGSIGTLLFFFSMSAILTDYMLKNKRMYLKDLNMFVVRQLSNRINTNFVSMSIICILLLLVIGIFSSGYSLQNAVSGEIEKEAPFDISLVDYYDDGETETSIYNGIPKKILEDDNIKSIQEISEYTTNNSYSDQGIHFNKAYKHSMINFIHLSDYNRMMEMSGCSKLNLKDGEYAILAPKSAEEVANQLVKDKEVLVISGEKLEPSGKIVKNNINNDSFMFSIIVNDNVGKDSQISSTYMNIQTKDGNTENIENMLNKISDENRTFGYYQSRQKIYKISVLSKALVSFLSMYLGFVFMIVCTAILAIQQLSEADDNKERYAMLYRIGADKNMINKALFKQILCYFISPLLLAVIHSIVGLKVANEVIKIYGQVDVTESIFVTSIFIILIYGIYFFITYIGSKKIIVDELKSNYRE